MGDFSGNVIDPHAEARLGDEIIIAALRTWSPERRSIAMSRLTALVRASSRQAWRAQHPELSSRSADVVWAEQQYGPVIGAALRRWLVGRA